MALKYYESYDWLFRKYMVEKRGAAEIAALCQTTEMTISRWLRKHNIVKVSRR